MLLNDCNMSEGKNEGLLQSNALSVCRSVCLFIHLSSVCLFVYRYLSICHLSVYRSVYPFVICLSVCLSICHLSACLSVYSFVICLSICLACPPVSLCLSVCFLWVHVCKVTLCELYLYCTGWGCGRLTAWPCSSLQWPGDFLAYNQIKKSLASQGKKQCPNYHTSRSQAHLIWTCCDGRLKVKISWPSFVSLRTFNTLILI